MLLSVIIPTYNEEKTIHEIVGLPEMSEVRYNSDVVEGNNISRYIAYRVP